jgi:hypothetical protein
MSKAAELAALIGGQKALGNKNLIINGAMQVAQRSTSAVAAGNPNYPSVDRYVAWEGTDGAYTVEQSTDAPTGFSKSLKAQVTTADTSLAAGQYAQLVQRIEAQDLQHLDYGLSTAKTLTLSFWVKSNKTGTYCITGYKEDSTGSASTMLFPKEFSISSANTWEHKTITIEPDSQIKSATGVIDDDNGTGFQIFWNLAQGSTYTGGTDGTWTTDTTAFTTTNQVNWMDNTSNNFYLTGIQLEIGDVATAFEHEDFGTTLRKCQRYYFRMGGSSAYARYTVGSCDNANTSNGVVEFPVQMRDTPTLETTGTASNYAAYEAGIVHTCSAVPAINALGSDKNVGNIYFASTGNFAAGNAAELLSNNSASAYIAFQSEL